MDVEEKRARQREATARYRAKQKELGIGRPPLTDEERERQRLYVKRKRKEAAQVGVVLLADTWWKRNPEKHRARTQNWRAENEEYARALSRDNQAIRRSTLFGRINNRLWAVMHGAVRRNSSRPSKYTAALGYLWSDLRAHLEARFTAEMTWENWGDVWELDHIVPVSAFRYRSLHDPLFKQAWQLSNLRPLPCMDNQQKGARLM